MLGIDGNLKGVVGTEVEAGEAFKYDDDILPLFLFEILNLLIDGRVTGDEKEEFFLESLDLDWENSFKFWKSYSSYTQGSLGV